MSLRKPPIDTEATDWVWKQWFSDLYAEVKALATSVVSDGDKGDITVSAAGTVWNIDADAVTNAELANMATQTFKGRTTAGTGDPEDLTVAQAKTMLNLAGTNSGDQTSIVGITGTIAQFNTACTDADFATGGGTATGTNTGDQTIQLTGDVTGSGTGSFAATIANDAVTNAKAANMANSTIKGRYTGGTGDPEDLTAAQARAVIFGTTPTDFGDLTIDGSSATGFTVENNAITNAKLADMAGSTVKGRNTAGSGDPEDMTMAQLHGKFDSEDAKFLAYRSAAQTGLASGSWVKVEYNVEQYDTGVMYDSTTNYRFTPALAGYYRLSCIARWNYTTGGAYTHGLRLYLNGATEIARDIRYPTNGYPDGNMHCTTLYYFNGSTDYVEVQAFQNSGSSRDLVAGYPDCQFCGERIGLV